MSLIEDRLKEIQLQLDGLMDEVQQLRRNISTEGRRRTYPFPFEPSVADERSEEDASSSEGETH